MKKEVNINIKGEIETRLKRLCGKPSPTKRLIVVLVISILLAVANIYFVVSSIYAIGKNSAKTEFLKTEHIEDVKMPKNDSINLLKQKMYE